MPSNAVTLAAVTCMLCVWLSALLDIADLSSRLAVIAESAIEGACKQQRTLLNKHLGQPEMHVHAYIRI